jgi:hypothetical protein
LIKFQADKTKFAGNESDQASERAMKARATMRKALELGSAWKRGSEHGYKGREKSMHGVERQIERLLQSGKGTQGQREFEGLVRRRGTKAGTKEWVIKQFGRMDLTRTGEAELEDDSLPTITPQNIPQTSLRRKVERPNIGVSAYQGIQLTGPRLSKTHKDVPEAPAYYQFDTDPNDDTPVYKTHNAK